MNEKELTEIKKKELTEKEKNGLDDMLRDIQLANQVEFGGLHSRFKAFLSHYKSENKDTSFYKKRMSAIYLARFGEPEAEKNPSE